MQLGHGLLIMALASLAIVPRRFAAAVFLVSAFFIPMGIGFDLGSLNFYSVRSLVLVGLLRISSRGERPQLFPVPADWLFVIFGLLALVSSVFHEEPAGALVYRGGMVLDNLGAYFLFRSWIADWSDFRRLSKVWVVILIPLGACLLFEALKGKNLFGYLGGISFASAIRDDRIRAQGPFRHSILAGTAGAVCLPLAITMLRRSKWVGILGIFASLLVVFASRSSGPIVTLMAVIFALWFWRYREYVRHVRWAVIIGIIVLHFFVMKVPVWFLIAKISFGGGGGFHRAKLIDSAVNHLNEWWLAGTDYTRHWMATGIGWSADHTDITNNYLRIGVIGGLPLMITFILILRCAFNGISKAANVVSRTGVAAPFDFWCLGAALFGHAVSMISVGYYDQSSALLIVLIAGAVSVSVRSYESGIALLNEDARTGMSANGYVESFGMTPE